MLKRLVCIIIFCTFASSIRKKARKVFERHVRIINFIINLLNFNNLTYGKDFLWTETEQEWEVEDFW